LVAIFKIHYTASCALWFRETMKCCHDLQVTISSHRCVKSRFLLWLLVCAQHCSLDLCLTNNCSSHATWAPWHPFWMSCLCLREVKQLPALSQAELGQPRSIDSLDCAPTLVLFKHRSWPSYNSWGGVLIVEVDDTWSGSKIVYIQTCEKWDHSVHVGFWSPWIEFILALSCDSQPPHPSWPGCLQW
jgi:hypothetical protein